MKLECSTMCGAGREGGEMDEYAGEIECNNTKTACTMFGNIPRLW